MGDDMPTESVGREPTASVREATATINVRTGPLERGSDDPLDYIPKVLPVICTFLKDYAVESINIQRRRITITVRLVGGYKQDFNGLANLLSRAIDELVGDAV